MKGSITQMEPAEGVGEEPRGRFAVLSGCSRGIGFALAKNLSDRGFAVLGFARSGVEQIVASLLKNERFVYHCADLATEVEDIAGGEGRLRLP